MVRPVRRGVGCVRWDVRRSRAQAGACKQVGISPKQQGEYVERLLAIVGYTTETCISGARTHLWQVAQAWWTTVGGTPLVNSSSRWSIGTAKQRILGFAIWSSHCSLETCAKGKKLEPWVDVVVIRAAATRTAPTWSWKQRLLAGLSGASHLAPACLQKVETPSCHIHDYFGQFLSSHGTLYKLRAAILFE